MPITADWKPVTQPVPQHVVQMMPLDSFGRVLVMHRSDKVRSARNVWSFPSGMHDIGEDIHEVARRELMEEYGLKMRYHRFVGVYENIAGDEPGAQQYHWVITLVIARVNDVLLAVNKEPDKHDRMIWPHWSEFIRRPERDFFDENRFHPSFERFVNAHRTEVVRAFIDVMHRVNDFADAPRRQFDDRQQALPLGAGDNYV